MSKSRSNRRDVTETSEKRKDVLGVTTQKSMLVNELIAICLTQG